MLTILHTNDFHNRFSEAQANRLRLLHDSLRPASLLLDAGDAIRAGNLTYHSGGEPILARMTAAGYDAMTVGNREFHLSRAGFFSKLSLAEFPALCANVRAAGTSTPSPEQLPIAEEENRPARVVEEKRARHSLPARPYALRRMESGWRVLIFGLTVPMITERMLSRKVSAFVFEEPVAAAKRLAPWLRVRFAPDLLIALTHIGLRRDRLLAETVPGIDLIIGGHSHDTLENGERVGETLIVQTGCYGHHLGRVEIEREAGSGRLWMRAGLEAL